MISIHKDLVMQIIFQAKNELPNECCGMLAGKVTDEDIKIIKAFAMTNIDSSPEHFSLDPKEQFQVLRSLREQGLQLLGNYHSHPATPSRPSTEDIRLAYDPKAVYMIISLAEDIPRLKCFEIIDGSYAELPLNITGIEE